MTLPVVINPRVSRPLTPKKRTDLFSRISHGLNLFPELHRKDDSRNSRHLFEHSIAPDVAARRQRFLHGCFLLLLVAILWGTWGPALKWLLIQPHPPSPALLTAVQSCLSLIFLLTATLTKQIERHAAPPASAGPHSHEMVLLQRLRTPPKPTVLLSPAPSPGLLATQQSDASDDFFPALPVSSATMHATSSPPRYSIPPTTFSSSEPSRPLLACLHWASRSLWVASLELAVWNLCAVSLTTLGIARTTATKAAFLTQMTALVTPLLAHLSGDLIPRAVWVACGAGVVGSTLVALDGMGRQLSGGESVSGKADVMVGSLQQGHDPSLPQEEDAARLVQSLAGQLFILGSCVFYALSTVRLGTYSRHFEPLYLACGCGAGYAALSLIWLLAEMAGSGRGGMWVELQELSFLVRDHTSLSVLLWAGAGPGALASYLQAQGQQKVSAAEAQVVFSSAPLWAALIAAVFLHGEAMGALAWVGGLAMIGAAVLAAAAGASNQQ